MLAEINCFSSEISSCKYYVTKVWMDISAIHTKESVFKVKALHRAQQNQPDMVAQACDASIQEAKALGGPPLPSSFRVVLI